MVASFMCHKFREAKQPNEETYAFKCCYLFGFTLVVHRGVYSLLGIFDSTRYMMKMIIECIIAMVPFATVTFSLMGALAVSYFELKKIEI